MGRIRTLVFIIHFWLIDYPQIIGVIESTCLVWYNRINKGGGKDESTMP